MRKTLTVIVAITLALALGVGVAVAKSGGSDFTVRTKGLENFEPNALVYATLRFSPSVIEVPSGATLTFVKKDDAPDEPHTLSIVGRPQLPKDIEEVFNCELCNSILQSHFPGGNPVLQVDPDNDGGLDVHGDSLLILPGLNNSISATVTAPPGTTLSYLCAFHPWMQGTIKVTG